MTQKTTNTQGRADIANSRPGASASAGRYRLARIVAGSRPGARANIRGGAPRRSGGYSLLEIMVTVLLVAILGGMSVNGINNWLQRRLHSADVQEIISSLYRVRQSSIMSGQFSLISISSNEITLSNTYRDMAGIALAELLDLESSIQILEAGADSESALTLFYTNRGRLLSGTSQFRVCSSALSGESPILFTISSSGQISSQMSGMACPAMY